jgi:LuxR family maltose regulon positive regulatory protein
MVSGIAQNTIHIPQVSGVIERPRLLAQLQAASTQKLTLICAPPGYGKTTLAAQFACRSSSEVVWHTVEDRERDVPNLFHGLVSVLASCVLGIDSLVNTTQYTPAELAAIVTDCLRVNTTRDFVCIFDDTHVLAGSLPAESFLQTMVDLLPPNWHLILIGRVLPNLPLTEMIARREVIAFGQDQLRFTPDEIHRLASETHGTSLTSTEIEQLASRLEGWPAGIVLALHPLPSDLEQTMLQGGRGPEALFKALASSMLDFQPPGLRDFLLASSTLFKMTPELCTSVLELPNSAYWINEAQRRSLFLSKIAGGLVYHGLFRDFLQQQLEQNHPERFVSLHVKAARWFESNDSLDDSFDHYMAAGLVERAAAIAEQVADTFFSQGYAETLIKWRTQMGRASVFAPRLLYNCGRIFSDRYEYDEAEIALGEAERGFHLTQHEQGIGDVQLQRAFIAFQSGQFKRAISEVAHFANPDRDTGNWQGRALRILGLSQLRLGEVRTAIANLEQALRIYRSSGDAYAVANLLQDVGVAYLRQGRMHDASACLQELVALRRSLGSPSTMAAALNNLGYFYHLNGNYEQSISTFKEGLRIISAVPNKRAESALLWSFGDVRRDQGAFDEAIRLYNHALGLVGNGEPVIRCGVIISSSTLKRWQGDMNEAVALAERALSLSDTYEIALHRALAQAALWAARSQLGDAAVALDRLDLVLEDLYEQDAHSKLVWVHALRANAALLLGENKWAESAIESALKVAQEGGSVQPLVAEIAHSSLLEQYVTSSPAKYSILSRELKTLCGEAEVKRTEVYPSSSDWKKTYSLRLMTLGRERIERDGEVISPSDWRSSAAREMFFYLLFNGPESRERISLVFWPDSPIKQVRSNFHTTLYRARQALGDNVISHEDGLYFIDPGPSLWCDVLKFEDLIQQARLMPPRDARTENLWHKASNLYHGDFLPSWDHEWVLFRRQSLFDNYIEALIGLGVCARARHNPREALTAFRRALDADPYCETAHRGIVLCYDDLGEKRQALAQFNHLRTLLREELGIEPSDETLDLAQRLLE